MQLHMQADGMTHKALVRLLVVIILISSSFLVVNQFETCKAVELRSYFYVDDDYNINTSGWQVDHFDNISDAIAASSSGDWIEVLAGTYNETFSIPHKLDIFGEGRDITTIDGKYNGDVITISEERVNISHFTIKNCGNTSALIEINSGYSVITDNNLIEGNHGIIINDCDYNIIYDNIIDDNTGDGIQLYNSDYNEITFNDITECRNGIFLYDSDDNEIENNSDIESNAINGIFLNSTSDLNRIKNNNIISNGWNGIFLNDHCDNNNISHNSIDNNEDSGIRIENSSSNIIFDDSIEDNSNYGIMILGSSNKIQDNTIYSNDEHGIFLFADDLTRVYNNDITYNTKSGIQLSYSTNSTIYTNEIANNVLYGVYCDYFSLENTIYNNYFHDNGDNAVDKSIQRNSWNITKTSGTNKVGGSYLCGNYWDDFDEVSEGAINDGDNITVGNYTVYNLNQDNGALLDVNPPVIDEDSLNFPSTAVTLGDYVYISVEVTDDIELKDVSLNVSYPSGIWHNFSILANKSGNEYYCNKIYPSTGNYTFEIAAKDPRRWTIFSSEAFLIDAGVGPTITDNSQTIGSPLGTFKFNATIIDDADAGQDLDVIVRYSHGNLEDSDEMDKGPGNFFTEDITLSNSINNLTYEIIATDSWGNSATTGLKSIAVIDSDSPEIIIKKRNYTSDGIIKTFTIGAEITDNHRVSKSYIEYWYSDIDHRTAEMDYEGGNYFEKVIQIEPDVNRVYCTINASDPSGNTNDSKKPIANASGPYQGINGIEVTFDGSYSYDLDGEIETYSWDFGDGTTGFGVEATNTYSTNGVYTITLTVIDDEGLSRTDTTYISIDKTTPRQIDEDLLEQINEDYDLQLTKLFYVYDIDGDDKQDVFVDPNNVIKVVHDGNINISNNVIFLLSVDDSTKPEFMWNVTTNKIIDITNLKGELKVNIVTDISNKIITQTIVVDKTEGWIFIEVDDPNVGESKEIEDILSVTKNNTEIDEDKIFRKDKETYILDDPDTEYVLNYSYKAATLKKPTYIPKSGSTIGKDNQTIYIYFNVPVDIIDAALIEIDELTHLPIGINGTTYQIINDFVTENDKNFSYTPPNNLEEGVYQFYISVKQKEGGRIIDDENTWFRYVPYAPKPEEQSMTTTWIIMGAILGGLIAFYIVLRKKNIGLQSYIYIKSKRIIPFFKPVVFGPLSIDVNDKRVSKAEFFVNGKLKDTITKEPYIWKFDDPMFMKQKIETKVYDESGHSSSSGEMTFYIFNPPHLFNK